MFDLRILKDYGKNFKYLTFKFPDDDDPHDIDNKHIRDMVTSYFLDNIFKYCTNLEHLNLSCCQIIRCNPSMSKSRSITTLSLQSDKIDEQVYLELSMRLVALKHLHLEIPFFGFKSKHLTVNVPYTNLESLTFNYSYIYRISTTHIAIKITTFDKVSFYEYGSTRNHLGIVESNIEEYESILRGQRNIGETDYYLSLSVCCQSFKKLVFKFSDGSEDIYDYYICTVNAGN